MVWKQDSIKQVVVSVVGAPPGEGHIEVNAIWSEFPATGIVPGVAYPVGGHIINTGKSDNYRFVICLLEPYLEGAPEELVYKEQISEIGGIEDVGNNERYFNTELTLPADYAGTTVTFVGIGFHEE